MIDRCNLTMLDIIVGNVVLWGLYLVDSIFTYKNLKMAKEWRPKKWLTFETNIVHRYFLKRWGLKAYKWSFLFTTKILVVIVILFPFVTPLLIGYLLCMNFAIHVPNYKYLKRKVSA